MMYTIRTNSVIFITTKYRPGETKSHGSWELCIHESNQFAFLHTFQAVASTVMIARTNTVVDSHGTVGVCCSSTPRQWHCSESRGGGGGISGMNLVQVCRWASSYPPYKCILEYGKSIPINVYTIMEDNKKCSLFPFELSCLMQKIISTVKC